MQRVSHRTKSFDSFSLDLTRGCLLRGHEEIELPPIPYKALKYLVENPGRLISKAELIQALWPKTAVTDDSLVQCVMKVRDALGDKAQQIVKTVHGRGYIFDREVSDNATIAPATTYTEETAGVQVIIEEGIRQGDVEPAAAEQVVPVVARPLPSQRRSRLFVSLIAIGCLSTVAAGIYLIRMTKPGSLRAFQQVTMTSLTSTGDVYVPVISPNGKYLAYSSLEQGGQGLRVQQVATGSVVQLVPTAAVQYWGVNFSRDSEYVYYVVGGGGPDTQGGLYRIPALGGHAQRLIEDAAAGPLMSPDGTHIVFARVTTTPSRRDDLLMADTDGKNERVIDTGGRNAKFRSLAWSPDGKSFTYVIRDRDADGVFWYVGEIPVAGGDERVIVAPRRTQIVMIAWLPEGSGLIMNAIDPVSNVTQIYFVSYPGGEERRITNDLNNYKEITVTADGRMIVAQKRDSLSQLWIAPADDPHQGRVLLTFAGLAYYKLSWTPDNHLVFDVEENGFEDLWKVSADGSGRERLTYQQGQNREPTVTSDGRHIVFISTRSGSSQIWRMNIDGNSPKQLGSSPASIGEPQAAPDGESVLYLSSLNGKGALFQIPLEGGNAREVVEKNIEYWAVSPDGTRVAYSYRDQDAARTRVAIVPFGGGTPLARFDLEPCYLMRWTRDGSGLAYIAPDDNIWVQPIAGGPSKQLTHFQRDLELVNFAWSFDGKQMAYSKRVNSYDAVAFKIK